MLYVFGGFPLASSPGFPAFFGVRLLNPKPRLKGWGGLGTRLGSPYLLCLHLYNCCPTHSTELIPTRNIVLPPPQVVLCFSPVGATLRVRSRKFPAIVNCTSINWFHEWPEEALVSVSHRFLTEMESELISVSHVCSLLGSSLSCQVTTL